MGKRGEDPAWAVWASSIGLVCVLVGLVFAVPQIATLLPIPLSPEQLADKELLEDPESGVVVRTIKLTYPDEFANLKRLVTDLHRRGAGPGELRMSVRDFMESALARHRDEIAQAPHDALASYRQAELRLYERLKEYSPEMCADTRSGPLPADLETRDLMINASVLLWKAAAAGRDQPVGRIIGIHSDADRLAIRKAMLAVGLTEADFQDMPNLQTASAATQCRVGLLILHSIDKLPPEMGDRIYAQIVMEN